MVVDTFNPTLRRQRQEDVYVFEVNLVYKASSRPARTVIQRYPVSKFKKFKKNNTFGAHFLIR